MIKYELFYRGAMLANTWIVYDDESKKCLIIDLNADFCEIEPVLDRLKVTPVALLLTHGHFDHVLGAHSASVKGIPVYISEKDSHMLKDGRSCLANFFGLNYEPPVSFEIIGEGTKDFGGITVETIATPGHTAGSVCYRIGDALFCGDTLFKNSYGRTDLPTGDFNELVKSAAKILKMGDLVLCPGHDAVSSIRYEREHNPLSDYAIKR